MAAPKEQLPRWQDFADDDEKDRNPYDEFTLIELMEPNAKMPKYATDGSAGLDLYALNPGMIEPGKTLIVRTGVKFGFQPGHFGSVRGRSGKAFNVENPIFAFNGTIDNDYQGEVKVLLINYGTLPYAFMNGDAIAQMVIQKYEKVTTKQVSNVKEIRSATTRGDAGFGSTDPKKV
jgi:dUTP pyrophosphatase